MDIKGYMDIMKFVMRSQIECVKEEMDEPRLETEYTEGYYAGIIRGLEIAMEKIDASMFLAER